MPHPDGTRAWRKSWRRKWREESTFRQLSPLAKLACIFSEENADDEGRITSTVRQMSDALGGWHHEQKIPRMTMWRAWKELEAAGLWSVQAGRTAEREAGRTPSVITRLNFKRYQESPDEDGTQRGTQRSGEAGHSGRGRQRVEKLQKGADAPPAAGWQDLIASLTTAWQERYPGTQLVWAGRDFKAVKTLLAAIPAAEIARRFGNYLASPDPFYAGHPVTTFCSQVNRFVAAPVRAAGFAVAESHESFAARGGGTQPW